MNVYDFLIYKPSGEEVPLKAFEGKVLLIVNTATGCGFTPQYEALEAMYREFHEKGLEIIDVPCNQFGGQTPGSDEDIHAFCTLHYNTTFPQMRKSLVNGEGELPLYSFLKSEKGCEGLPDNKMGNLLKGMFEAADPLYASKPDIKWNFTKFLVDRKGNVVARFEPPVDMDKVKEAVEGLL